MTPVDAERTFSKGHLTTRNRKMEKACSFLRPVCFRLFAIPKRRFLSAHFSDHLLFIKVSQADTLSCLKNEHLS
jgi:hypothetical protein